MENGSIPLSVIGERIKEERERLKLSVTDFAAGAGVSDRTQRNYESGQRLPDAEYLARAVGLGVDVDYVLTGERANWKNRADEIEEECDLLEQILVTFEESIRAKGLTLEPAYKAKCARWLFRAGLYGAPVNQTVVDELLEMTRS